MLKFDYVPKTRLSRVRRMMVTDWKYVVFECKRIGRAPTVKPRWRWSAFAWSILSRCADSTGKPHE